LQSVKVMEHNTVHREQQYAVLYRVLIFNRDNTALERKAANEDKKYLPTALGSRDLKKKSRSLH